MQHYIAPIPKVHIPTVITYWYKCPACFKLMKGAAPEIMHTYHYNCPKGYQLPCILVHIKEK